MKKYEIIKNQVTLTQLETIKDIEDQVKEFAKLCLPFENILFLHVDDITLAVYCECHVNANKLMDVATIDVPLDPDEQSEYRANREIVEDHVAYEQMKSDAKEGRSFSNIVAEFDTQTNPNFPIKIIGGQHRYIAIKEACDQDVNKWHGLKIYFNLDKDQRLDVQLISNVNIAASTDLYDRLQETARGPELRNWCQKVGFLDEGHDFSSKRQRGSSITVREVRSFIVNFYMGKDINSQEFENVDTTPLICKTGKPDPDWENIRNNTQDIWNDNELKEAAQEFIALDIRQKEAIEKQKGKISQKYADKALNFSILSAWIYVAGMLVNNQTRLKRHFTLKDTRINKDPLNAEAMANSRHRTDPEKYRGLGTRSDV